MAVIKKINYYYYNRILIKYHTMRVLKTIFIEKNKTIF